VDRTGFLRQVTETLENLKNVEVIREEVSSIPQDRITIIGDRSSDVRNLEQGDSEGDRFPSLFFYDRHLTDRHR